MTQPQVGGSPYSAANVRYDAVTQTNTLSKFFFIITQQKRRVQYKAEPCFKSCYGLEQQHASSGDVIGAAVTSHVIF